MSRTLYTKDEIILCTYIARYGTANFNESRIKQINKRSLSSVVMKVQNIAAMLDEEGFKHHPSISKLTGKPTGEVGRRTNWDIVKKYTTLEKEDFLEECRHLIKKYNI